MKTCVYKVILLGNTTVGKTTLFRKLCPDDDDAGDRTFVDSIELCPCTLEFNFTQSVKVKVSGGSGSIL
jgi:GTPase SAR1 family protein